MSSIPLAKWSSISELTVTPEKWESYPIVERSTVESCSFQNLTSSTSIQRSNLNKVTLRSHKPSKGSYIKRCNLTDSVVADSSLKRCKLSHCVCTSVGSSKWTKIQGSLLENVSGLKRCAIEDSEIRNTKSVRWSTVKRSSVAGSARIKRSTVEGVRMVNSIVDRSSLTHCDVTDCEIYRTNFTGMVLENGIWRNGQLVGRTNDKEVVMRAKSDTDKKGYGPSINKEHGEFVNIPVETADPSAYSRVTETVPVTIISGKKEKLERRDEKRLPSDLDSDSDNSDSDSESDSGDSVSREKGLPPPPYEE